jgi:prepilin-type processing-associated H-X9-DG protein
MIMAAVFIPSMREARRNGLITDCRSNMGQIGTALESFSSANNGQLPVADLSKRRWLFQSPEAASNSAALFQLVQHGYIKPPVFQCPAVGGPSFAVKGGMVDFPAPEYVNYSYQHSLGGKALCLNDPCRSGVEPQMAILADATPVFDGGAFHPDRANDQVASVNHDGRGQNVLFLDWHVDWAQKPTVGVGDNNIFLVDNVYTYKGDEAPASPKDSFLLPAYSGLRQP